MPKAHTQAAILTCDSDTINKDKSEKTFLQS